MQNRTIALVCVGVVASLSRANAGASVDALLCKRQQDVAQFDARGNESHVQKPVLDVIGDQPATVASPDGALTIANRADAVNGGGFVVVDARTNKSRAVHNRDREYDCDVAVTDDGKANSVRWLGNAVVFAQGWYCSEFDAKPYLANGKTGKFIGYVKLKGASPEAIYNVAHVDGALWAVSLYDHNSTANRVVVVDTKSGKIKSTKEAAAVALDKLPACPK
jgi:hypothetical protein